MFAAWYSCRDLVAVGRTFRSMEAQTRKWQRMCSRAGQKECQPFTHLLDATRTDWHPFQGDNDGDLIVKQFFSDASAHNATALKACFEKAKNFLVAEKYKGEDIKNLSVRSDVILGFGLNSASYCSSGSIARIGLGAYDITAVVAGKLPKIAEALGSLLFVFHAWSPIRPYIRRAFPRLTQRGALQWTAYLGYLYVLEQTFYKSKTVPHPVVEDGTDWRCWLKEEFTFWSFWTITHGQYVKSDAYIPPTNGSAAMSQFIRKGMENSSEEFFECSRLLPFTAGRILAAVAMIGGLAAVFPTAMDYICKSLCLRDGMLIRGEPIWRYPRLVWTSILHMFIGLFIDLSTTSLPATVVFPVFELQGLLVVSNGFLLVIMLTKFSLMLEHEAPINMICSVFLFSALLAGFQQAGEWFPKLLQWGFALPKFARVPVSPDLAYAPGGSLDWDGTYENAEGEGANDAEAGAEYLEMRTHGLQ